MQASNWIAFEEVSHHGVHVLLCMCICVCVCSVYTSNGGMNNMKMPRLLHIRYGYSVTSWSRLRATILNP